MKLYCRFTVPAPLINVEWDTVIKERRLMQRAKVNESSNIDLPESIIGLFKRNGYVRTPNVKRLKEGHRQYKKGWEVRLVLNNTAELSETRRLLTAAGLKPGRPFRKNNQLILPLYGQNVVDLFRKKPSQ